MKRVTKRFALEAGEGWAIDADFQIQSTSYVIVEGIRVRTAANVPDTDVLASVTITADEADPQQLVDDSFSQSVGGILVPVGRDSTDSGSRHDRCTVANNFHISASSMDPCTIVVDFWVTPLSTRTLILRADTTDPVDLAMNGREAVRLHAIALESVNSGMSGAAVVTVSTNLDEDDTELVSFDDSLDGVEEFFVSTEDNTGWTPPICVKPLAVEADINDMDALKVTAIYET